MIGTDLSFLSTSSQTLIFLDRIDKGLSVSADPGETWQEAQSGLEDWDIPFIFTQGTTDLIYGITHSGEHAFLFNPEAFSWVPTTIDKPWGKIEGFKGEL